RTGSLYEACVTPAGAGVADDLPLAQPRFWKGQRLVNRQRSLPAAGPAAAVVLGVVALPRASPVASRFRATLAGSDPVRGRTGLAWRLTGLGDGVRTAWCRYLLAAGAAVVIAGACTAGWPLRADTGIGFRGFIAFCEILLAVQAGLLLLLAVM